MNHPRALSTTLLLLLLFFRTGFSQENPPAPQAGFVQLINLVSLKKPTYIEIAGISVSDGKPIATGESSGVVALIPNQYPFTISNESAKPNSTGGTVSIENGRNVVIVFFDEEKEYRDGSKETKLRYSMLKELAGEPEARLSLVSLSNRLSTPVSVNGKNVILAGRKAHPCEVTLDDRIEIRIDGISLGEIEVKKPIHYIGFVFDDPETGKPALSVIREEKLEYHPPLDDEAE